MATLYELTEEYRQLLEMMEDDSVDPEVLQDTLEERLENCVSFIERGIKELQNKSMDEVIERKVVAFSRKYDDDKILKGKHLKCTDSIVDNVRKSLIEELENKKRELEFYL